jgi:rRNA maturation endonuclease Nob1
MARNIDEIEAAFAREIEAARVEADAGERIKELVLAAAKELDALVGNVPAARLNDAWDRLSRMALDAKQAEAKPRKPSRLGNLFANATANVEDSPFKDVKWERRFLVLCTSCGAPQQTPRDFKCAYCGADVFRRPGEDEEGGFR